MSLETVFINLLNKTGIRSWIIGRAKIYKTIGLIIKFSTNWNSAFIIWGAPLKLLTSQASNMHDIAWMQGVDRSLDLIKGFIYRSSKILMWNSCVLPISLKSP
jgi:hypothetical protein